MLVGLGYQRCRSARKKFLSNDYVEDLFMMPTGF